MAESPNYFGIIPADVRYDKELAANAKLLYSEITALASKEGFCWASNDYFAQLYEVNVSTIQRWLLSLENKGYIERKVKYKDGTKQVEKRFITIIQGHPSNEVTPTSEIRSPHLKNKVTPPQKQGDPHLKNEQDNNTSINNTINNTNNNNNIIKDDESDEDVAADNPLKKWQEIYGGINAIQQEDLQQFTVELGSEIVLEALRRTALVVTSAERGRAFGYLRAVLQSWKNEGISTLDDIEKSDQRYKQANAKPKSGYTARTVKKEIATDWSKKKPTKASDISDEEIQKLINELDKGKE